MTAEKVYDLAQRAVINSSPLGIVASDLDGAIVVWNRAAEELFGWPAEETIGRNFFDLGLLADDQARQEFLRARDTAFRGEEVEAYSETRRRRRDGSVFTATVRYAPLRDEEGEVLGIIGFVADVTEERARERELAETEQRLRAIFEQAGDAIFIFDPEADEFLDANPRAHEMLGYPPGELLRRRPSELLGHERAAFERFSRTVLADGIAQREELSCADCGGDEVPCEVSASRVIIAGRPWIVSIVRDTRERGRTEQALRDAEQRYRDLYEQAPNAYFEVGADGRIRDVNRRAESLLGYPAEELVGRPVADLYAPDSESGRARSDQVFKRFVAGEEVREQELEMRTAHGAAVWVSLSATHITDEQGRVIGSRSIVEDVTARREAQEALRRSHEELRQLASGVAHDLAEPLRTVASYSQLLQRGHVSELDEDGREFLDYIQQAAGKLRMLLDSLRDYVRVGHADTECVQVDLEQVVEETRQTLAATLTDSGVTLSVEPLPTLCTDPVSVSQVLQNLIANAVKFRSPGTAPQIRVSAERHQGAWCVTVADNGPGVPYEQQDRLFDMFYRGHRSDVSSQGMGLAVCRRVVERNGGRIWVDSRPGEGSTFRFTIPDADPDSA